MERDSKKISGSVSSAATRRLLADWQEILSQPHRTISAAPSDADLFTWHCNLSPQSGIYRGIIFHLELHFPQDYPHNPPKLTLCYDIPHPNVFGRNYICLNMLRPREDYGTYSGWSTAYTAQAILLQLESFLFAEKIDQDWGGRYGQETNLRSVVDAKQKIMKFKCSCGHTHDRPFPPLPEEDVSLGFEADYSLPPPLTIHSHNTLNPLDKDDELFISPNNLFVSKKTRHGWKGVRASKGDYLNSQSLGGLFFEAVVGRGLGVCRVGFSLDISATSLDLGSDDMSWGFGGTGKKAHKGEFVDFGEGYAEDDVIGSYCNLTNGDIYFFKNGICLGRAFTIDPALVAKGCHKVYPTICLRESGVRVNFGRSGWLRPPHFALRSNPTLPQRNNAKTNDAPSHVNHFDTFPKEMLVEIFSLASFRDLLSLARACKRFASTISACALIQRAEVVCYHSKATAEECNLGIGLVVDKDTEGRTIFRSPLDLISSTVFHDEKLKVGMWGEKLDHYLPLIINPAHAKKSKTALISAITNLSKLLPPVNFVYSLELPGVSARDREEAASILAVLPRLMNQAIVQILLDTSSPHTERQVENKKLHIESKVSERALLGFCSYHHILLHLVAQRPSLKKIINAHVDSFLHDESYCTRANVPDLGEFLVMLACSDFQWTDSAAVILREIFERNAKWVLRAVPFLKTIDAAPQGIDQFRLDQTFSASKTSFRILMFQVFFMAQFAAPSGKTTMDLLQRYNLTHGRPNEGMKSALVTNTFEILKVNTWPEFFSRVLIACPSKALLTKMLVSAQQRALSKQRSS